MMICRKLWIAVPATIVIVACGCEQSPQATTQPKRPKYDGTIAFVGAGPNDPIWPILRSGAKRFEQEQGVFDVRYVVPEAATSDSQAAAIRSLISPSLRGLCVQVINPQGLKPVLMAARQQGAVVITMLQEVEGIDRGGHVGYDDVKIGETLAQLTNRHLGGKGAIMVLHAGRKTRNQINRYKAFNDELSKYREIERWADIDCNGAPTVARREMAERTARYPRLSAWVSLGAWPLQQCLDGQSPIPAGQKIILDSPGSEAWSYIQSGVCPAAVAYNYHEAGMYAMQYCQTAVFAKSESVREYLVPIQTLTAANLDGYMKDWAFWSSAEPITASQPAPR